MKIDRALFKKVAALRLTTPHLARGPRQGNRRSPNLGRGVEFADYRPYSPGDDLRLVDWNVYARLEVVLVRLFHEDLNMAVHVAVDASGSMDFGQVNKADHAAQLGAALALVAMFNQDTVSLGCIGGRGPKAVVRGQNENGFPAVLKLLERVEPAERAEPWRELEAQLHGRTVDRLFFLSDMLYEDDDRERILRLLASASSGSVLLHVLSQEELDPDLSDAQLITDAETAQELLIAGGDRAAETYQRGLRGWLDMLQERCQPLGIQYVPAHTHVAVDRLLLGVMRQAGVAESATGEVR